MIEPCVPVLLGPDCIVDPGVLLGYRPGRNVDLLPVEIGGRARLRTGTVIYASVRAGERLETGHGVIIREENRLGDDCSIWNHSTIDYGCVLGHRVRIHCNVYIAQYTTIEDDVFLAPGTATANDPHPLCTKCMQGPTIRTGARVGMNATVLPHVIIGENALVGAGSVVTHDVPPRAVVVGNPARQVADVDDLECPFDLVRPYVGGLDVRRRPEWHTVAALARPVARPARKS